MTALTSDELLVFLRRSGIEAPTAEHPPVFTVAEAQRVRGEIPGRHTKNLFLRDDKKNYFLVVVAEEQEVDLKQLRKRIGARGGLSFASQDALAELLGIEPGSVSPLAVINDRAKSVKVVIDEGLLAAPLIACHPLVNSRTTVLTPQELLAFLTLAEHEPLRLDIG